MKETAQRAAVIQAVPIAFDLEGTVAKIESLTHEAATRGAQLVLFPEAFVGAYARPDIFTLIVDETRKSPVVFKTSAQPAQERGVDA